MGTRRLRVLPLVFGLMLPLAALLPLAHAVLLGLAALAVLREQPLALPEPPWRLPLLLVALLLGLGLLSAAWSTAPDRSLEAAFKAIALSAAGLVLSQAAAGLPPETRRRGESWLLAGLTVGLGMLLVDGMLGRPLERVLVALVPFAFRTAVPIHGAATLVLLTPLALELMRARGMPGTALLLLPLVGLACLLQGALVPLVGLAAALLAMGLVRLSPRRAAIGLGAVAAFAFLAAPLAYLQLLPIDPVQPRLIVGRLAAEYALARPLLGYGLQAYASLPPPEHHAATIAAGAPLAAAGDLALVAHPHSVALQLWLDLGMLGALVGALLVATLLHAAAAADRRRAAAYAGTIVAYVAIGAFAFDMVQTAWVALAWLVVASGAGAMPQEVGKAPGDGLCSGSAR